MNILSDDGETIIPDVSVATEGRNENTFRIAFDNLGALQSIGDNEVGPVSYTHLTLPTKA